MFEKHDKNYIELNYNGSKPENQDKQDWLFAHQYENENFGTNPAQGESHV